MARSSAPRPTSALTLLLGWRSPPARPSGADALPRLRVGDRGGRRRGRRRPDGAPRATAAAGSATVAAARSATAATCGRRRPGHLHPARARRRRPPQCADCIDNDGDGKIDAFDPECAGPLDNDEATFGTGIPGDNQDAQAGLLFDGNSGPATTSAPGTGATRRTSARPRAPTIRLQEPPGTPARGVPDFCAPLAPNGCDCFGCCSVPKADGGVANVRLPTPARRRPRRPDEVHAVHAVDRTAGTLRHLRVVHRQGDAFRRSAPRRRTAAPATPARRHRATRRRPAPQGNYCLTGCCVKEPVALSGRPAHAGRTGHEAAARPLLEGVDAASACPVTDFPGRSTR